jgi:hypothetical protein
MIMQEDAEKRPGGAHEGSLCADLRCVAAHALPPSPPPMPTRTEGVHGAHWWWRRFPWHHHDKHQR